MALMDIILGILLLMGLWKGLKNGLLVELASIIALIAGIYGAIHFSYIAGDYLSQKTDWNEQYLNLIAFAITFIIIVIAVHMAGKVLTKIASFAMLGIVNKLAGGAFGALKMGMLVGALLVFLDSVDSVGFMGEDTKEQSILYKPVKQLGAAVFALVLRENGSSESVDDL